MVTHGKEEICTLFGRRGRISIFYTDKEGLAAKVVHALVEHVILNRTIFSREAVLGHTSSSISSQHGNCREGNLASLTQKYKASKFLIMLEKEFKDEKDMLVSSVCKYDSSNGNLNYCGTICLQVNEMNK